MSPLAENWCFGSWRPRVKLDVRSGVAIASLTLALGHGVANSGPRPTACGQVQRTATALDVRNHYLSLVRDRPDMMS